MVPLIELRGAIPIAVGMGIPLISAYIIAVLGNRLPVPFIYCFARKILLCGNTKRGFNFFLRFWFKKGELNSRKLREKAGKKLFIALMLLVGFPLPGTGAWTGILVASMLDMDFKKSVIAVIGGVLMAGAIMGVVSTGLFGVIGSILDN